LARNDEEQSVGFDRAARTEATAAGHDPVALQRLRAARAFLFDMDGVLYRGPNPLPGVNELLDALVAADKSYILATNNSMASPASYTTKLAAMGLTVPEERILTAGTATRDYLADALPADAGIYAVGMPALFEQLFGRSSFREVSPADEQPAAVVIGLDLAFTYEKLRLANAAIRGGARFVATNADATLPTEHGLVPGAGSIVAAIATSSGQQPTVIGKPSPRILEQGAEHLGVSAAESVMIGDRLDTDILAGQQAGMLTVMVLTGVSTRDEVAGAAAAPDLVVDDLPALLALLDGGSTDRS
jgi:4-nitrophenyl phosphatase